MNNEEYEALLQQYYLGFSKVPTPKTDATSPKPAPLKGVKGVIVPNFRGSLSVKALSEKLGFALATYNSIVVSAQNGIKAPLVVNWGDHSFHKAVPETAYEKILNTPQGIDLCMKRSAFYKEMQRSNSGPRIPDFTLDVEVAKQWGETGEAVFGREDYGQYGLDAAFYDEKPDKFFDSQIWIKYKKRKSEFRIHIFDGKAILSQKKILPKTGPDGRPIPKEAVDFRIRTFRTGFVYQSSSIFVPTDVHEQALKAFNSLKKKGITFCAVDVIYNETEDKGYVIQAETAPPIVEYVDAYADAVKEYLAA